MLLTTLILTATATHAALSKPVVDPLAPSRKGMLQCYSPDLARRKCRSISGYRPAAGGTLVNAAVAQLAPNSPLVMATQSGVTMNGNAVCGKLLQRDIERAVITTAGKPIPAPQLAKIRGAIIVALKPAFGKSLCTTYVLDGEYLVAQVAVDGKAEPDMSQKLVWVKPTDGFTVGQ
jgi:hypothetical protein